jgi:hypothetical protein
MFNSLMSLVASAQKPSDETVPNQLRAEPPADNSLTVTARSRVTDYANEPAVNKANEAVDNYTYEGSPYGEMSKTLKHGKLSAFLSLLGDSLLVGNGAEPEALRRFERQKMGNAMVGAETDMGAAASRVAATGVPDSASTARQMYADDETSKLRKLSQQQQADYRAEQMGVRRNAVITQMTPYAGAILSQAKTPEEYRRVFDRVTQMVQRADPDADATVFGAPPPDLWQPGDTSTTGATTGQVYRRDTSQAAIAQRDRTANQRNATTQRGQDLSAGKATTATIVDRLVKKQNNGQTLTASEQKVFDKATSTGKSATGGRGLSTSLKKQTYTEGRTYADAKGNKAKYVNGKFVEVK